MFSKTFSTNCFVCAVSRATKHCFRCLTPFLLLSPYLVSLCATAPLHTPIQKQNPTRWSRHFVSKISILTFFKRLSIPHRVCGSGWLWCASPFDGVQRGLPWHRMGAPRSTCKSELKFTAPAQTGRERGTERVKKVNKQSNLFGTRRPGWLSVGRCAVVLFSCLPLQAGDRFVSIFPPLWCSCGGPWEKGKIFTARLLVKPRSALVRVGQCRM